MRKLFYREFTVVACALAIFCVSGRWGAAQQRGEKVAVIAKDATIDVAGRGAVAVELGAVLDVRGTRGNWVRVEQENGGWISKAAIKGVAEADTYLSKKTTESAAEIADFHALAQLRGEIAGWQQAVSVYDSALRTFPESALAFVERGMVHSKLGNTQAAVADYEKAIQLDPNMVVAINNLAWIRATGEAEFRNGQVALELATKAWDMTKGRDGSVLDTLAAANAELGRFADASKWQIAAIRLSERGSASDALYQRLKLYSDKQAFRAKSR